MKILLRLLPYYTPYRGMVLGGLACVLLSAALGTTIPGFLQRAIDALDAGRPTAHITRIITAMLGVALLTALFRYLMRDLLNGLSRRIETDLRDALFAQLTRLDAAWRDGVRTGDVMARLTNDVGAVRMATGPAIMYLTNTLFGGLFAALLMWRIDARLTLIALAPMLLLPVVMVRLGRRIHDRAEAVQATFGDLSTRVQEHVAGVRVVRAYRQEAAETARFEALSSEYERRGLRLAALQGLMSPLLTLLAGLGGVAVLGLGGRLVLRGDITPGQYVAFVFYLGNLTWPLIALGWVISLFQRGAAAMRRLSDILDAAPAVGSPSAPRRLPPASGGRALTFDRVHFAYPGTDGHPGRPVLHDLSFTVPAGGIVGLVGGTGAGKTTLLELIPRLRDPSGGSIRLDGVDLRDLSLAELRAELGMVPQEALLFSDTIGANLAYGSDDAEAVAWATRIADLADTIAGFRDGTDTMLGERGVNLSGGQQQRATLARALARRPAVVLLDDALSAVDTATEARILRALRGALAGRTALIATHRASALRHVQQVLVLEDGRLVEQGTPEALVAARGRYWALIERQALEEAVAAAPAGAPDA